MIFLCALIVVLSIYEIRGMAKKGQKKEIAAYICFAVITLLFGIFYLANPFRDSFSQIVLNIMGIEH